MEEHEIIKKLSELHKAHSKDPKVLCFAIKHDFELNDSGLKLYPELQAKLFIICSRRGDKWLGRNRI